MFTLSANLWMSIMLHVALAQVYYNYYPHGVAQYPYYYQQPRYYYPQNYYGQQPERPRQQQPYQRRPQTQKNRCNQDSLSMGSELVSRVRQTSNQISRTRQHLERLATRFPEFSPFEIPRMLFESTHSAISLSRDLSQMSSSADVKCMSTTNEGKFNIEDAFQKLRSDQSELSTFATAFLGRHGSAFGTLFQLLSKLESSVTNAVVKVFSMMHDDDSSSDGSQDAQDSNSASSTDGFDSFQAATTSSNAAADSSPTSTGDFGDVSDSSSSSDTSTAGDAAATPTITSSPPAPSATVYTFSTYEIFTFTDIKSIQIQGQAKEEEFTFRVTDNIYFTNTLNAAAGPLNSLMANLVKAGQTSLATSVVPISSATLQPKPTPRWTSVSSVTGMPSAKETSNRQISVTTTETPPPKYTISPEIGFMATRFLYDHIPMSQAHHEGHIQLHNRA